MKNSINWFEIPVVDYARAKKFYSTVLNGEVTDMDMPDAKYGVLPCDMKDGVGGGLIQMEGAKPSQDGVVVYLNGGEDLSVGLAKVENAGGKIIIPKTAIGPNGFMAQFIDTEGNRVALHSMN